jgi:hypothetical protein
MGTRADFYVGRGKDAEWVGSIRWSGYPHGYPKPLLLCYSEEQFRREVREVHRDFISPEQGWPWSWDTSHNTNYTYAFDDGRVWVSLLGCTWEPADSLLYGEYSSLEEMPADAFPNMRCAK